MICRLKVKVSPGARSSSAVVTTLPTSTTNITGLRIMVRGLSFRTESHKARRTMRACQTTGFDLFVLLIGLESLACMHQQVFENWAKA